METIYLCIVIFLFGLAVFALIVGVSNDAVNFLQSSVGAKAASFKTVLFIAGIGVFDGIQYGGLSALIFSGDQGEIFCNRNDRVGKSIPVDQLYIT